MVDTGFHSHQAEGCAVCGENHPFDMPPELVSAALSGDLVIFAGAGISTESRRTYGGTFADRIARELGLDEAPSFPELMTAYEQAHGRAQLLQRIRARIDYVDSFPELRRLVTRFHHELATAYFLRYVVTTNWDTYFEEIAAATPIVNPDDYAFWNVEGRKVFKLHGSMHNLSTIVATKADYDRCYRRLRTGIIGSTFQHLLATKRVVFVGYSFGDSDLNRMLRYLRRELADILPRSYVVTPHGYRGTEFPAERVIQTDGTFFIQKLKDIAVERHALRDPEAVSRLFDLSERLTEAHGQVSSSFHVKEVPAVIHTLAYQDGMRHAIDRVMARMGSGEYFDLHGTMHKIQAYEEIRTGAIRARRYFDAAYADGYEAGLIALELDGNEIRRIPLYFVWGSGNDLRSFAGFRRALRQAGKLHKAATNEARRLVADVAEGLIVTHEPFLDVDRYRALGQTPGGRGQ